MTMQFKPFKASRRKILPGLNIGVYEARQDRLGRTTYRSIPTRPKTLKKEAVTARRSRFIDAEKARRTARGQVTRRINEGAYSGAGDYRRGQQLLKGIESLARTADGVTSEQMQKLHKMDPSKIDKMYQNNDVVFDVYFQYKESYRGVPVLGDKQEDVQFLIDQYERIYGVL